MKICSICHKISATDDDHLDCQQKLKIELEDKKFKENIPEKLDLAKNVNDLGVEIKAFLEHIKKENSKK